MSKKGVNCKLYRNTATYGSPTWNEVTNIRDFSQTATWGKAEVPGTRGNRVGRAGKTNLALSWTGTYDKNGDEDALFIESAMLADTVHDFLILDGALDVNGSKGYRCDCQIFKADEDQGVESVLFPEIEIMPTFSSNKVKSVTVTSGAPVYTDIPTPAA